MKYVEAEMFSASILIVDDKESNIRLLQKLLSGAGYTHINSTLNPREVSTLHREHGYDLILLDLEMPDMDGFQVMEALKTSAGNNAPPVLVITAQPDHKLRALQAGARDFISKPFDVVEVKARIRNLLETWMLYKKIEDYNKRLEQMVYERTSELRESEARYRSLTELGSDWYWEQDEKGIFTKISGPVLEMLGMRNDLVTRNTNNNEDIEAWNKAERRVLETKIATRQPFHGLAFSRMRADGSQQRFQVSGAPMFNELGRFVGYRGIAVALTGTDPSLN